MKMQKLKMSSGVYNPKIQNQGQFWNPQDKQISKLTSYSEFGEDLMEILTKQQYTFL